MQAIQRRRIFQLCARCLFPGWSRCKTSRHRVGSIQGGLPDRRKPALGRWPHGWAAHATRVAGMEYDFHAVGCPTECPDASAWFLLASRIQYPGILMIFAYDGAWAG